MANFLTQDPTGKLITESLTDGNDKIKASYMPSGIGADVQAMTASEAIAAGDFVNIYDDAGNFRIRLADASTAGKQAHGFVLAAIAQNASGDVYFEGSNGQLSGLAPGNLFLSASNPGKTTATAPTATGNIVQPLGVAVTATIANVELGQPIEIGA